MINKTTLNTRGILIRPENRGNIQTMFEKCNWGSSYISNPRAKEVLTKLLNDIGISQICQVRGRCLKNDLFFDKPTMIIKPVIHDVGAKSIPNFPPLIGKKFYKYSGYRAEMKINLVNAPLDNNIKRLMYDNVAVADYYSQRNLLIVNFNIIPKQPKLTIIKSSCNFLKEVLEQNNVIINNTFDSKKIAEINMKRNAKIFIGHLERRELKIRDNINIYNSEIIANNKKVIKRYKDIQISGTELKAVAEFKSNFQKNFENQLKSLEELEFVESVKLSSNGILIDVGNLSLQSGGVKAYIGHMSFLISPEEIQILNKYPKGHLEHPHVSSSRPCFGSHSKGINKLLGELDLKRLVFALYQFLYTYTGRDVFGGGSLTSWKQYRTTEKIFDSDGNKIKNEEKKVVKDVETPTLSLPPNENGNGVALPHITVAEREAQIPSS